MKLTHTTHMYVCTFMSLHYVIMHTSGKVHSILLDPHRVHPILSENSESWLVHSTDNVTAIYNLQGIRRRGEGRGRGQGKGEGKWKGRGKREGEGGRGRGREEGGR